PEERRAAFADFMAHDEPDFAGWIARVRASAQTLYPAEVRMVTSEGEMRTALKDCHALVVESFRVGAGDLAAAGRLQVVQKLGIIGFGEIGREIALRGTAFGMRVLYHQRTRAPEAEEREAKATYVPLATLLAESDWIAPQVPTSPATRDLLGRAELTQLKPGACIVNVANAPIINRDALLEALRAGRLGGVALDVHYQEPVPDDDELLSFDNVILTPRMAG